MTRSIYLLALVLGGLMFWGGCSGKSTGDAQANFIEAFQSADATLKAKAEFVTASFKTNNYVATVTTLQEIGANPALTPQQQKAVDDMREMVNTQLYDQVDQGDPNAIQARDVLQQMRRRPR